MFGSYAQLTQALVADANGIWLLDAKLTCVGTTLPSNQSDPEKWVRTLGWSTRTANARTPVSIGQGTEHWLTALP